MQDVLLTKKDIAGRIGKSAKTVSRWARAGTLPKPAKVVGMREYWSESQIAEFVGNCGTFADIANIGGCT